MPKTYQAPEQKQEHEKEKSPKTVGVYDQPERTGPSKQMMIVLAVIVAIVVLFILYRLARGETPFTTTDASAVSAMVGELQRIG